MKAMNIGANRCMAVANKDKLTNKKPAYLFSRDKKNFSEAQQSCEKWGGNLVSIHSDAERKYLSSKTGKVQYWIGLNDQKKEGKFVWTDNTPLDFKYFSPN